MEIKPLSLRRILSLVLSAVLLITALALPVSAATTTLSKISVTGTADYKMAFEALDLVNAERKKLGRPALVMDKTMMEAAMQRAAECSISYSHTRPDGSDSQTILNWRYSFGENIAAGHTSANAVIADWMNSPGHKANIMDEYYYVTQQSKHRYQTIGIGVFKVGDTYYWCQLFNGAEKTATPTQKKAVSETFTFEVQSSLLNLSYTPKSLALEGGKSATIEVSNANTSFYYAATPLTAKGLTYSSSDTAVATVSDAGKVTGVGAGSAKITVKCQNGRTLFTVPVTVKNEKVDASIATTSKGVKISWGKVTGATAYKVYKSLYKNGKWQSATLAKSTTSLSYTDTTLSSGEKAKYTVYAYAGKKEFESHDSVTGMYLAQPQTKVTTLSTGAKISWDKVTGATSYKVYRSTYSGGKWSDYKIYTSTKSTTYTDKNVKSGQKVRYTVYAVSGSYKSAEKAGVATLYLSQPAAKVAKATKGVKVSWGKVTGATSYKVYRSVYKNGKWSAYSAYKSTTSTSYTDTKATSGTKVRYTVYAVSGSYKSAEKAGVATLYLSQPAAKVAKATKGVKVSWGKVTGATSYKVYRSVYKNGKWSAYTVCTSTKSLSYTDKTIQSGQKVRYTVYAVSGSYKSAEKTGVSITR